MRVVLDTNVLVSGIFFTGPPYQILQGWRRGDLCVVTMPEIIREYGAVIQRLQDRYPGIVAMDILGLIVVHAKVISAPPVPAPVSVDPDDDKFLACAVAGSARYLVSGDKDLLSIGDYEGVQILRPRAFLQATIDESSRESYDVSRTRASALSSLCGMADNMR